MPDSPSSTDRRSWRRVSVLTLVSLLRVVEAIAVPLPQVPGESETRDSHALTPDDQRQLAESYAPVLAFHPLELYFPVNPLFPLDQAAGTTSAGRAPASLLGTAASRRARYEALSLQEKARLSTVYYRVFPVRRGSQPVIVVEYRLYYVHNAYRVRGNLVPIWVDGSHPNDLEHIHIVLRPTDSGFLPEEIYASSHAGTMPFNRYRFTDGDERRGLLWGIRDRGVTWAQYNRSYMTSRRSSATTLEPADDDRLTTDRLTYRLVPVEQLTDAVGALDLTGAERAAFFETHRSWYGRLFGSNNGSAETLLVPPRRHDSDGSIGVAPVAATERGFLVGGIFNLGEQLGFVAARYAYLHQLRYLPDVMVEVDAVRAVRRGYVAGQLLGSYPIDGSIKVLAGRTFVTDSFRFDRRQWNWTAGLEIRLGRMRFYGGSRSLGPIVPDAKEFRLAYFF